MHYYLGGYCLVQAKPLDFGSKPGQVVVTASECVVHQLLGYWAYPSEKAGRKNSAEAEKTFGLDTSKVDKIREWVGAKVTANLIGWAGVFLDIQTAIEYRDAFFSHVDDILLLAIYFSEAERAELLKEFKPESENLGEIDIYRMLLRKSVEADHVGENLLGFDLIGIEYGGNFHSFHCHDMADELSKRFGLVLNQFGLFNEVSDWQPILDYMNDEETGCEPVPWFVAKVKLVDFADEEYERIQNKHRKRHTQE